MAIANAKARFLARIRKTREIPVYSGMIADRFSRTRDQDEVLEFHRFGDAAVAVHSESGREYIITTDRTGEVAVACSCPDHQFRHRVCRHMEGYNLFASEQAALSRAEQERQQALEHMQHKMEKQTEDLHTLDYEAMRLRLDNRVVASPSIVIPITDQEAAWDRERDRALYEWAERHAHDGVFMSEDDKVWTAFLDEMSTLDSLGVYERVTALDGSTLTFGIELEVEGVHGEDIARALKQSGLTEMPVEFGHKAQAQKRDTWIVKSDESLRGGCEVVSPPLRDTPETWEAIQEVAHILSQHGARTSKRTGFHIHMSHEILDDRGYRWQRLARYMFWFGAEYYRMGAASDSHNVTPHRGLHYAQPLQLRHIRQLRCSDTAREASRKLVGYAGHDSRYKIVSTAKFLEDHVPTVEFRYPNGTIDPVVIQRQIQLANATMMQAAYLRRNMPAAYRLPALFGGDRSDVLAKDPEGRFRQFLDTLGSDRLRRIATGLWVRGSLG